MSEDLEFCDDDASEDDASKDVDFDDGGEDVNFNDENARTAKYYLKKTDLSPLPENSVLDSTR